MNPSVHEQEGRGRLFDRVAKEYQDARPGYPEEVFNVLARVCELQRGSRVLEIGAGTGQATLQLIERGAHVTAVEPGANLAAQLRDRTRDRSIEVIQATFEDAQISEAAFDLVVSATAFHWVDAAIAVPKVAYGLKDHGWFAAWSTKFGDPDRPDPFHEALQPILAAKAPEMVGSRESASNKSEWIRLVKGNAAFGPIESHTIKWEGQHNGPELRRLFSTFSPWLALPGQRRKDLLDEIERLARDRFHNSVVRPYRTEMRMVRRGSR